MTKASARVKIEHLLILDDEHLYVNRAIVKLIEVILDKDDKKQLDPYLLRYAKGLNNSLLQPDKERQLIVLHLPQKLVDRSKKNNFIFNRLVDVALIWFQTMLPCQEFDGDFLMLKQQCTKRSCPCR